MSKEIIKSHVILYTGEGDIYNKECLCNSCLETIAACAGAWELYSITVSPSGYGQRRKSEGKCCEDCFKIINGN